MSGTGDHSAHHGSVSFSSAFNSSAFNFTSAEWFFETKCFICAFGIT
jgi:hypothetical protein